MKKYLNSQNSKILITVLGIGFIFLLWFILSISLSSTLFPDPGTSFNKLGTLLTYSYTWQAIGGTLLRLLISFVISVIIGGIIGIFAGLYINIYRFLHPLIIVLRTLPTAAVIYVLIVLAKPQFALYIIVFLLMFPIVYEAFAKGIQNISTNIFDAVRIETHKLSIKAIYKVYIPSCWPTILLGLIQALGLGMKVSIMSEVLCGSDAVPGLGRIIYHAYNDGDMSLVFAASIIAIVLSGILDYLLHISKENINKYKVN